MLKNTHRHANTHLLNVWQSPFYIMTINSRIIFIETEILYYFAHILFEIIPGDVFFDRKKL